MLSLSCTPPQPHATWGVRDVHKPKANNFHPESANSISGSARFCKSKKWVLPRRIDRPKSMRTDAETSQATQSSGDEASSPEDDGTPSSSFLSVLCPLLKFIGGGDPSRERNEVFEVATSSLSSLARLPWGRKSLIDSQHEQYTGSPLLNLQVYEFEACPFCRRVREALTELDLTVEVFPCPKGSLRHREIVQKLGGKEQFPFLVDPNTGASMYESGDIIKYLFQQYGQGRNPSFGLIESTLFTGWVPTLLRAGRGMTLWSKAKLEPPPEKLELFSFENNPVGDILFLISYRTTSSWSHRLLFQYARIIRETLCELELPYILQNVGEGSSKIQSLVEISGSQQVPFLVDVNTGTKLGDYKKILSYLFRTYSTVEH